MYFLIADTHMGHENICRYCERPIGFENIVMERWRDMVGPEDVVIHLGDLSFDESWVQKMGKLPGRKILIRGNHDRLPLETYIDSGWIPMEVMVLRVSGIRIVFSHRPLLNHPYDINIHGHQHDLHVLDDTRLYFPVALEHTRYAPLAMNDEFIKTIRSFVDRNHQPTTEEIHSISGSDRPLSDRDFYGGFGKEARGVCRRRLAEGYSLMCQPDAARVSRGYRLWHFIRQYLENKIDFNGLTKRINSEVYGRLR